MTDTLERVGALETRVGKLEEAVAEAKRHATFARSITEDAWCVVPRINERLMTHTATLNEHTRLLKAILDKLDGKTSAE